MHQRDLIGPTAIIAAALAGCGTTPIAKTYDLSAGKPPKGLYAQYVLPQTIIVATITEAGGGEDDADAAPDDGEASGGHAEADAPAPDGKDASAAKDGKAATTPKAAPSKPVQTTKAASTSAAPQLIKVATTSKAPQPTKATGPQNAPTVTKGVGAPITPPAKPASASKPPQTSKTTAARKKTPRTTKAATDGKTPTLVASSVSLPVRCPDLKADYTRLDALNTAFVKAESMNLSTLKAMTLPPEILKPVADQADKIVETINAGRTAAAARDTVASTLLKAYANKCAKPLKIEVSTEVAPDVSRTFALAIPDDQNSSDKLTIKPDLNGLLTSVTTTADDKSGDIAVAAVKSLISAVYVVSPGTLYPVQGLGAVGKQVVTGTTGGGGPGLTGKRPKPIQKISTAPYKAFIEAAEALKPIHEYPHLPPAFPKPPAGPLRYKLAEAKSAEPLNVFSLEVDCAKSQVPETVAATTDGVLTSSLLPCSLKVNLKGDHVAQDDPPPEARTTYFSAWDSNRPVTLPLDRTRLVSRTTTYAFDQGRLTSSDYDKPSDALAGATLPGTIIFGAVDQLSKSIQGRNTVTGDQATLLESRAKVYTQQAAILNARASVIKAQADLEKAGKKDETAPTPAPATE